MAADKETSTRAEQIQKERAARLEKLIRTLEAGQDKDADQFKKVDKLEQKRVKIAKKEEKFEDLGKKLFQSTMGGMFGGMGKSIPEPVKIMGRMVGVMFGARARIKQKKAKLLKKVYKRAAAVGMDTSGYAEKSPEALEEIDKNLDAIESIELPEEPKPGKPSGKPYKPMDWLLGKGPTGGGVSDKTPAAKKEERVERSAQIRKEDARWAKLLECACMTKGKEKKDGGFGGLGKLFGAGGLKGLMAKLLTAIGLGGLLGGGFLAGLGAVALPAAIIAWGVLSAVNIFKDWKEGMASGGFAGAVSKALAGKAEGGWVNSIMQASKWAGFGAMAGLGIAPPLGILIGALIGAAFGGIFGWLGSKTVKEKLDSVADWFGFPIDLTVEEEEAHKQKIVDLQQRIKDIVDPETGTLQALEAQVSTLESLEAPTTTQKEKLDALYDEIEAEKEKQRKLELSVAELERDLERQKLADLRGQKKDLAKKIIDLETMQQNHPRAGLVHGEIGMLEADIMFLKQDLRNAEKDGDTLRVATLTEDLDFAEKQLANKKSLLADHKVTMDNLKDSIHAEQQRLSDMDGKMLSGWEEFTLGFTNMQRSVGDWLANATATLKNLSLPDWDIGASVSRAVAAAIMAVNNKASWMVPDDLATWAKGVLGQGQSQAYGERYVGYGKLLASEAQRKRYQETSLPGTLGAIDTTPRISGYGDDEGGAWGGNYGKEFRSWAEEGEYKAPLSGTLGAIGENVRGAYGQLRGPLLGGVASRYGGALSKVPDWRKGKAVSAEAPDSGMQGAPTIQNMSAEAWKTTTTSRGAETHKDYGVIDPETGKEKSSWAYRAGKLSSSKAFIIHHTAGRGTAEGVMNVFKKRNVSSNFIIDRDGAIWRAVPPGFRSQHMRDGQGVGKGLNNSNTQSVEIIAKDDADVTSKQVGAAMALASSLGYKAGQVLGHGEVNSHKRKTEGNRVISAIRGEPRLLHRDEQKQVGSGKLEAVKLAGATSFASERQKYFGGSSVSAEAPDASVASSATTGLSEQEAPVTKASWLDKFGAMPAWWQAQVMGLAGFSLFHAAGPVVSALTMGAALPLAASASEETTSSSLVNGATQMAGSSPLAAEYRALYAGGEFGKKGILGKAGSRGLAGDLDWKVPIVVSSGPITLNDNSVSNQQNTTNTIKPHEGFAVIQREPFNQWNIHGRQF